MYLLLVLGVQFVSVVLLEFPLLQVVEHFR
jgi:hypothetical protein